MQSELAWQSLQVIGKNHRSQLKLINTGLMQHGTVDHVSCKLYGVHTRMRMTTDLSEFCQMSSLFRVRRVSDGASDVVTLLQQLFNQFSANKAACTRHSGGVCTATINGAHTDCLNDKFTIWKSFSICNK